MMLEVLDQDDLLRLRWDMYKNTVSEIDEEDRADVRVRSFGECDADVKLSVASSTDKGVRVLIFPNEELLISWRQRLAALA